MSGQASGWVLRHGPRPDMIDRNGTKYGARARGLRAVLVGVADAANADGHHAHPGNDNLVSFSLYGRRQVSTLLAELLAECWLLVEEQGGGKGKATVYGLPLMGVETSRSLHGYEDRYRAVHGDEPRSADVDTAQSEGDTAQSRGAQQRSSNGEHNDNSNVSDPGTGLARLDEWADDLPAVVAKSGLVELSRELCGLLETTLTERGYRTALGKARSKRWLLDMEALLRVDERPVAQVRWVIGWLHRGDDRVARFWRTNVRSPDKLRVQWDVMREQYRALEQASNKRADAAAQHARAQGRDPDEARADADALVQSMFGGTSKDSDSQLKSDVIDVESRGA